MNKCPLCASSLLQNFKGAGKEYFLKQCSSCKLIFEDNSSLSTEKLYNEQYYESKNIKGGYYNYIAESVINKLTFIQRLRKIEKKFQKNAKLLDIGCALGDFLEVAKDQGWSNSYGLEVSDYSIKSCLKKGLKVYKIGSKEANNLLKNNSFDIVTLQDVIEHVQNPLTKILEIHKILRPNGMLFLTTPNIRSLSNLLLGKYWYHYKKGEHLLYFNESNIKLLLQKAGFTQITVKPTSSWVTTQYVINRLRYYFPQIKSQLVDKICSNLFFKIPFPLYTGEIEAWAIKPK